MSQPEGDMIERVRLLRRLPQPAVRQQLRQQLGVSQAQVAQILGVSRECVSLWETRPRAPRGENLRKYVELLERLTRESV